MSAFKCKECDFLTQNRKDYNRHIQTKKHLKVVTSINNEVVVYKCICSNEYKYKNNFIRHQKICPIFNNNNNNNENDNLKLKVYEKQVEKTEELMNQIIIVQKEKEDILQKHLEDKEKRISELTNELNQTLTVQKPINHKLITKKTINNQQNNTYNINITNNNYIFALNEKFPDALTYNDFLKILENSVGDLTRMANKPSFIDQISNMICEKMLQLDDSDRPLHYIEGNGETGFYLKQDGQWDKTTNEEVGNKIQITAKCISKIRNTQWEDILNSGNVTDQVNDNWIKYVKHITQEVTPDELQKNILKLKKATILKGKSLQNL